MNPIVTLDLPLIMSPTKTEKEHELDSMTDTWEEYISQGQIRIDQIIWFSKIPEEEDRLFHIKGERIVIYLGTIYDEAVYVAMKYDDFNELYNKKKLEYNHKLSILSS